MIINYSNKVTVCIIAYNHGNFIKECIEGVVNQITNFQFNIVICNDSSTDDTHEICVKYSNNYPNLINYHLNPINLGMIGNWLNAISKSNGEYIALCEGDDYWSDNYKLQKQVDLMDSDKTFSLCFHPVKVKSNIPSMVKQFEVPRKKYITVRDIILNHYIPTCSILFRHSFLPTNFPEWYNTSVVADIPLEIFLVQNGPAVFIESEMAVYRKHEGGITMNAERNKNLRNKIISMYKNLNISTDFRYSYLFKYLILKNRIAILRENIKSRLF